MSDEVDHSYFQNHYYATNYYVYVPHTGTGADETSGWHKVYYKEDGKTLDGYYYTFYYYKNSMTGSGASFSNGSIGDTKGSGSSAVVLMNNYQSCACSGILGGYSIKSGKSNFTNSTRNGTDGKIYTIEDNTSTINYLKTNSTLLACQNPSNNSADSHTFTGTLYAKGYRLYYEKEDGTRVYLDDSNPSPVLYKTDSAYTGALYEPNKKTRLDAMKEAAASLAANVNDQDRIAVVGFTDSANILTGSAANNAFVSSADATTAINGMTAAETNKSSLAAGISKANDIFAANSNDDSRKRVVVVFTDVQPTEDSNSWTSSAQSGAKSQSDTSEESYNAAVYTVGICIDDSATKEALNKISTNYYGSSNAETADDIQYAYNGSSIAEINSAATSIATAVQNSTTMATLDSSWVLTDVISDNFDILKKKVRVSLETVNGSMNEDGSIKWNNAADKATDVSYNLSDKTLTVTGFDFSKKYIAKDKENGQKLVVTLYGLRKSDMVTPEGDRVYSNDATSGMYQNGASKPFATFPRPSIPYDGSEGTVVDDASLTATEVYLSKHMKVIAGTVLDSTSTVKFKVQLRSIEDEYYVEDDADHSFAKHDNDHTTDGALTNDVTYLEIPLSLQTDGKTPKDVTPPGHYSRSGASNGIQTYVFGTGNILDEIIFPHAGWYVFDISEDTTSYTVNGDTLANHDSKIKMTADDTTHYTMKVYVENQEGDDQLVVTNATVRRGGPYTLTYDSNGDVATRTLGNGGTDADSNEAKVYLSKDRDQNGVTFDNEYLEPQDGQALSVGKLVDVETEDSTEENPVTRPLEDDDLMEPEEETSGYVKDQTFHFMAVASIPESLANETKAADGTYIINIDSTKVKATIQDANGNTVQDATRTPTLEISNDGTDGLKMMQATANLKHGERLVIAGLPAGASYIVREDDKQANGSEDAPFRQQMTKGTSTGSIGDKNNGALEIEVTNTKLKKDIPIPEPEGLTKSVSLGVAGALIALMLAAAGWFFLRSKLKEEEH